MSQSTQNRILVGIKILHTLIWLFFAGCIVAISIEGAQGRFLSAMVLTGLVLVECAILVMNKGRCPLTDLAARHTCERADNFDIYLPLWLARHNHELFGTLFIAAELFVLERWLTSGR